MKLLTNITANLILQTYCANPNHWPGSGEHVEDEGECVHIHLSVPPEGTVIFDIHEPNGQYIDQQLTNKGMQ